MSITSRKRGKKTKYEVTIYLATIDGERQRAFKTFDKYSDAREFEAQQLNFKNNVHDPRISSKVLFAEVARKYIEQSKLSDNTRVSYNSKLKNWINPLIGHYQIGNINSLTISRLLDAIKINNPHTGKSGASESTEFLVRVVLDNIFSFACNSFERYILESPMTHIPEMKKEAKALTVSEYWNKVEAVKFLKEAAKTPYFNMFVFMLNCGPRIAEVAGITRESFDLDAKILNIAQQLSSYSPNRNEEKLDASAHVLGPTKSYAQRSIALNAMAIKSLERAMATSRGRFLFTPGNTKEKLVVLKRGLKCQTISARHITQKTIYLTMKEICKRADVKFIGPHGCRHTFSANFLMNGGDIYTLSKLLGHKSVQTTISHYGHLSKEFLASAAKIVSFGDGI
jgi:integrase